MISAERLRRHLCFLDVGHGNSTVLIAGEDSVVVIDVGRQSALSEFLREQDIAHVDSVYLSHADADHIGALVGILATQRVCIGRVFLNSDASKDTQVWDDLIYELNRAHQAGTLKFHTELVAGRTERLPGGVRIRALGPSRYLAAKGAGGTHRSAGRIRTNSISAVLSITVADATLALLTGDVDRVGLHDLLESGQDLRASVLVYPHHGARPGGGADSTDDTRKLLSAVQPSLVVFSIGRGRYATPNPETVGILRERLPNARIVCTQLSEHCSEQLPDQSPTHLSQVFALGRTRRACCGGTVVVPLDDLAAILPQPSCHLDFIRKHARTALCY